MVYFPAYYVNNDKTVFYRFADEFTAIKVMLLGGTTYDDFGITFMYSLDKSYLIGVNETCVLIDALYFNIQYQDALHRQADSYKPFF